VSGTLGSNIFEYFSKSEHIEAWGICRDKSVFISNFNPKYPDRIIELDLSEKYENEFIPLNVDLLIHAAAITPNSKRVKFNYLDNISISNNVIEISKLMNVKRFFMLSSGSVYKNNSMLCNEDSDFDELNSYGKSMLESEKVIQNSLKNVTVFRLFYVYGVHYYNDTTLVNKLRKRIANNIEIRVSEKFDTDEINPLYFNDLISVVEKFYNSDLPCGIYNLAGPKRILFKYFLHLLSNLEGEKIKVVLDKNVPSPLIASTK
jgi:nucleoside-diphosphate-sugar epimerase